MEQESVPFLAYGLMTVTTLVLAFATVFDKTREIDTFLEVDTQEEPVPLDEVDTQVVPIPPVNTDPIEDTEEEEDEEIEEEDNSDYVFATEPTVPEEKDVVEGEVRAIPNAQPVVEQS